MGSARSASLVRVLLDRKSCVCHQICTCRTGEGRTQGRSSGRPGGARKHHSTARPGHLPNCLFPEARLRRLRWSAACCACPERDPACSPVHRRGWGRAPVADAREFGALAVKGLSPCRIGMACLVDHARIASEGPTFSCRMHLGTCLVRLGQGGYFTCRRDEDAWLREQSLERRWQASIQEPQPSSPFAAQIRQGHGSL
jgi:hypothetical protein